MTTVASQITSLTVVYSIVYSSADQRKHQSSASLAFVRGIHWDRRDLNGFLNDLISSNVTLSLNQDPYADPNENYELLHNHVTTLKNKHIPTKYVKFNKYRHKGSQWITRGVMRSIRYKDKLYRDLKRTNLKSPMYAELKTKLNVYNKLLKKIIREAKKNYYENQFQSYKSDIRKTWGIISEILSKKHRNKSSIKSIVIDGKTIAYSMTANMAFGKTTILKWRQWNY